MRLTRSAYVQTIEEDVAWLRKSSPSSLERDHIVMVLRMSVDHEYGSAPDQKTLRGLVEAWIAADEHAAREWMKVSQAINADLLRVGGYATTSSNRGFCKSFYAATNGIGWAGSVEREGEKYGGTGPNAETVAPHHPEVGDRCFALEMASQKHTLAAFAAKELVEERILEALFQKMAPSSNTVDLIVPPTTSVEAIAYGLRAMLSLKEWPK